jgi:hypothetical protein
MEMCDDGRMTVPRAGRFRKGEQVLGEVRGGALIYLGSHEIATESSQGGQSKTRVAGRSHP